jgi:hypothetical protein
VRPQGFLVHQEPKNLSGFLDLQAPSQHGGLADGESAIQPPVVLPAENPAATHVVPFAVPTPDRLTIAPLVAPSLFSNLPRNLNADFPAC